MSAKTHDDFIDIAVKLAGESVSGGGFPFGAVVVKDGQIVGDSSRRSPALPALLDHAELAAMINAATALESPSLPGCVLYSSCEPCDLCLSAAKWLGIGEIHFAVADTDMKDSGHMDKIFIDRAAPIVRHAHSRPAHAKEIKTFYDKR